MFTKWITPRDVFTKWILILRVDSSEVPGAVRQGSSGRARKLGDLVQGGAHPGQHTQRPAPSGGSGTAVASVGVQPDTCLAGRGGA